MKKRIELRLRRPSPPVGLIIQLVVLSLSPPGNAAAQSLVPLVSIVTNQTATLVARFKSHSALDDESGGVLYADPSQITYPTILPGTTIAGPAGPDVQVNDPSQDTIQYVTTWKWPFEYAISSETTLAADGSNIVVSYNHDDELVVKDAGNSKSGPLYFAYRYLSHYAVSHDGGQTWRSARMTPVPGSIITGGDGVVTTDRAGNFYYASLGRDANFNRGALVAKSTDHGDTFAPAVVAALDPNVDKEWIAIGPDPITPSRDNIYLAWQSISDTASPLLFTRSTDGGTTWSPARTIFSYTDDGVLSSFGVWCNPVVDKSNGRLYVPFVHLDHLNGATAVGGGADVVRILASDDGGNTFYLLPFNVPGAPDAFGYPNFWPGTIADCGIGGGVRSVIKQGPDVGGGFWGELFGLPRYVHCTRLTEQPATVAQNGRVIFAVNSSIGDALTNPAAPSQIMALYSKNGGSAWFPPLVVAPATAAAPRHFHPATALSPDGNTLYVAYYVQGSDERVRTEMATLLVTGNSLQLLGTKALSSVSFDLAPNNIPSPIAPYKGDDTINFDQFIVPGYALGEYMGLTTDASGNPMAAWGDSRNTWISPSEGLYPGPHPKPDVFFARP